jgi:endonuclease G
MLSNPVCERDDSFKKDPLVVTSSASNSDYKNSGYSRGHLAPAADMLWNETAMTESFYFSNMSPQTQDFNNGIWKELEEQVREWPRENEEVFVVTGPVLDKEVYPTVGKNEVAVPEKFYKVILDYKEPDIKAIGFIVPHEDSDEDLEAFAVSVDTVEEATGFDFFYSLQDEVEEEIEASVSYWE